MANHRFPDIQLLRAKIAAAAARLIVEDGADYGTAKRKAAIQILGSTKIRGNIYPDNLEIENEVRVYNELFLHDTQPVRLLYLRKLALQIMKELEQFTPYLTGAVLNGTAGEYSDIYLHLYVESPKDIEIFLLNKNIKFEVSESRHCRNHTRSVEVLSFLYQNEGVHLTLYGKDDLRNASKKYGHRIEQASFDDVYEIINESTGI